MSLSVLIHFIDNAGRTIGTTKVDHAGVDVLDDCEALGRIADDVRRAVWGKLAATKRIVLDVAI